MPLAARRSIPAIGRCHVKRPAVVLLALALHATPLAAGALPAGKVARVGMPIAARPRSTDFIQAFEHRLRELGYVEGHNLVIEFRTGEGRTERYPTLAADLVKRQVDVLLSSGPEGTLHAARHATSSIPIVMVAIDYDPVALGYVAGLPRPGGNITGLVFQAIKLTGKRLELLKDTLSPLTRVAVLWDSFSAYQLPAAEAAARGLGVRLQPIELRNPPYAYASAVNAAAQGRAEALLPLMSPVFFRERARLLELVGTHRLPAIYGQREFVEAGGFMAYGVKLLRHVSPRRRLRGQDSQRRQAC
jgi:putative ABC transport system substrate-binding protein